MSMGFSPPVAGGESGPGFRLDKHMWAREIREQCRREKIAFFYKQGCGPRPGTNPRIDGKLIHEFPKLPGVGPSLLLF